MDKMEFQQCRAEVCKNTLTQEYIMAIIQNHPAEDLWASWFTFQYLSYVHDANRSVKMNSEWEQSGTADIQNALKMGIGSESVK